jgi:hypothetical protein
MSGLSLACELTSFRVSLLQAHQQGDFIPQEGIQMSTATLSRASGLTLLLGALLFIIGSILSFAAPPLAPLWLVATGVYISGMALLLLGLPGIVTRQATCAGWLGFVGFLLTFLGWFLLTGFYIVDDLIMSPWLDALAPHVYAQWFFNPAVAATIHVVNLLLGAGGVLLGVATMRAGVLPRWAGLLLIAAAVAALGSFVNSNLTSVAVGLVALGLGWIGYALWSAQGESKAIPQPAPAP